VHAPLHFRYDGYGIDQVGILLTSVAVAMVFGVLIIGEVGDKLNPKMLLCVALLFCSAGAFLIVAIENYYALLAGFVSQGIGISVWRVVPYNQLTQIVPLTYYPKWYGYYEICMSMLSAGGARMIMMISTVMIKSRWGWRLPWLFVGIMSLINFFLLMVFAKFEKPRQLSAEMKKMRSHSYAEKFMEFVRNPIGVCLFISLGCAGFGFLSLAAWAPYISYTKFGASYNKVQITMAIAATVAYPVSVGGCAVLVYKTMGRIEDGLKYSVIFIIPATLAACYVSLADSFMTFVIPAVLFLALGFFPCNF
jgi:MFS family permease